MTRRSAFIAVALLLGTTPGCLSYRWQVHIAPPSFVPLPDDVPPFVQVTRASNGGNYFAVTNVGHEPIFVSYRESIAEVGLQSIRVVSGDTRRMHNDMTPPDVPIAPGSTALVSFYDAEEQHDLVTNGKEARFRIALRTTAGNIVYAVMQPKAAHPPASTFVTSASDGDKVACYVTAFLYGGWCWFVHPGDSDRIAAEERARSQFQGTAADHVEYVGRE